MFDFLATLSNVFRLMAVGLSSEMMSPAPAVSCSSSRADEDRFDLEDFSGVVTSEAREDIGHHSDEDSPANFHRRGGHCGSLRCLPLRLALTPSESFEGLGCWRIIGVSDGEVDEAAVEVLHSTESWLDISGTSS